MDQRTNEDNDLQLPNLYNMFGTIIDDFSRTSEKIIDKLLQDEFDLTSEIETLKSLFNTVEHGETLLKLVDEIGIFATEKRQKGEINALIEVNESLVQIVSILQNPSKTLPKQLDLSFSYYLAGQLKAASKLAFKVLKSDSLSLELQADCYKIIGAVYRNEDNFDRAEMMLKRSLVLYEELGNDYGKARVMDYLWANHFQRGEFREALTLLKEAEGYLDQSDTTENRSELYFDMFRVALAISDGELIQDLFEKLKIIKNSNQDDYWVSVRYDLATSLLMLSQKRIPSTAKAYKLLTSIAHSDFGYYGYRLLAMQGLTKILLDEIKLYGNPEVIDETRNLIKNVREIGQSVGSFSIIVESLLLESKFSILDGKLDLANNLLTQAIITCEEGNLGKLIDDVIKAQEKLNSDIEFWNDLIKSGASIITRLEQLNIEEYLNLIQNRSF